MTTIAEAHLEILDDADALARRAAVWLAEAAGATAGNFAVALSGGNTPRRLYENLAGPPHRETFPWGRSVWFWGDERFVPHGDDRSNYRMAREALLAHVPVKDRQIHPVPTEGCTPDAAAAAYEQVLHTYYGAASLYPARPIFDVVLLGLGEDGHTASVFPGTSVLGERRRWVAPVIGPGGEWRITLTYPLLESSRRVAFLASGAEKRAILTRLLQGDAELPAARLRPVGSLSIFADRAAAP